MEPQSILMCGIEGLLGGLLAEMAGLYQLRQASAEARPDWLKSAFYWTITLVMVVCGGGLAALYQISGSELNPILALNVGASAPIILRHFTTSQPQLKVS